MKNKRSILLIIIVLILSVFSTGCMNKVKETIGTKAAEKMIEKATDGEVEIDTKDGVSIETKDGSMKTGENLEWPEEDMNPLPKPDAQVFSLVKLDDNATTVILKFNKQNGGDDYLQRIIDMGYIQTTKSDMGEMVIFMAVNDDNTDIMFTRNLEDDSGSITLNKDSEIARNFFKEYNEAEEDYEEDYSDSMEWPKDTMDNLPELRANITGISINENTVLINFTGVNRDTIVDYIEDIISLGFDIESTEYTEKRFLNYSARNNDNKYFTINWSEGEGSINYTKQ